MAGEDTYFKKVRLLDTVFNVLSLEEMTALAGSDLIVAKLKGAESIGPGPFKTLEIEVSNLSVALATLREDMRLLVLSVNKLYIPAPSYMPFSQEMQTLKSRHHLY